MRDFDFILLQRFSYSNFRYILSCIGKISVNIAIDQFSVNVHTKGKYTYALRSLPWKLNLYCSSNMEGKILNWQKNYYICAMLVKAIYSN